MKTITLLGIDVAKNVFQLHGVDQRGCSVMNRQLTRSKSFEFTSTLAPCCIAMEACAGTHYLARKYQAFGHEVKLIAPQFVKPFVKGNKDDAADAEAICEAASRPSMRFVSPKSVEQQDLQAIHRIRQRFVKNRTALINEIRGLLYEYGIIIPQGRLALEKHLRALLAEQESYSELTHLFKELLQDLFSELLELEEKIKVYEKRLARVAPSPQVKQLQTLPGIGLITATALIVVLGHGACFKNGRQFSAYLGLAPKHSGSGGKTTILGISKRGNAYLRCLLIHGARAVLRTAIQQVTKGKKLDPLRDWVYRLYLKKGFNKACVALANKNARIAWALIAKNETFQPNKAAQRLLKAA